MIYKPEDILKRLKENEYAPIYFLYGPEVFYIDQITEFIEENALTESEKGFNQMILYGKDVSITDILNNAKRFPMMSERQVVIIKEAQDIQDFDIQESQDSRGLQHLDRRGPPRNNTAKNTIGHSFFYLHLINS